eukprot:1160389-Pelagomonas_calceolata.AAC.9
MCSLPELWLDIVNGGYIGQCRFYPDILAALPLYPLGRWPTGIVDLGASYPAHTALWAEVSLGELHSAEMKFPFRPGPLCLDFTTAMNA